MWRTYQGTVDDHWNSMPARVGSGPKYPGPGPVNAFETPTNRRKMNLIRTLFVLRLSKHKQCLASFHARPGSNSDTSTRT